MRDPSEKDKNDEIAEVLERLEPYILSLARRYLPRNLIRAEVVDLETDEVVQRTLINLWRALSEDRVTYIMSYTRTVVRNECINIVRRQQPHLYPLPLDHEGEFAEDVLTQPGQEAQNPAEVLEQREILMDYTTLAVHFIVKLPRRQKQAMIMALRERVSDIFLLQRLFAQHGVDIMAEAGAAGKKEKARLQASLSVAQKKLRKHKNKVLKRWTGFENKGKATDA